jgi:uncharacterized protein (TIGR02466 family)
MGSQGTRWSEASDVIPMFPTLVWKVELEAQLREAVCAQALAALARMRRDLPALAPGQGWQSFQSLHELDDFRDLMSCVHRVVLGILRFLRIGCDAYQITACWATVLARGAAHPMHQHPNNFLSDVYYVRTHPGANTINFHDPRNQTGIIRPGIRTHGGEYRPSRRESEGRDDAHISRLPAAFRRRERERRREGQHQLQHHVFLIYGKSE